MKPLVFTIVGRRNVGRLDYVLGRLPKDPWGGPLNGQEFRRRIYAEMMSGIEFAAIVETGTFRGTTTEFFADSGLPVYSVEIDPRPHGFAVQRLAHKRNRVHLFEGTSPDFLHRLAERDVFPHASVFFYLDAHVQDASAYHKAPLVEELEIIFANWNKAVVMVDDFKVPGKEYLYDDWGPGRILSMECLSPLAHLKLAAFFPAADAKDETGAKRGCVVLCQDATLTTSLRQMNTLRELSHDIE